MLCLKAVRGLKTIRAVYCDRAPELIAAALQITRAHGRPQNNAIIERANQDICQGTRATLIQAGLPPGYWHLACQHYCHMEDTQTENGSSAWYRRHGEHFAGQRIPFGSRVRFVPSDTSAEQAGGLKWGPTASVGVFLGYEMAVGGKWHGK